MAKTTSFGFSNTTVNANASTLLKPVKLELSKNYSERKSDTPDNVVLVSAATPLDAGEMITYKCQEVKKVSTGLKIHHPCPVSDGIQYTVRIDDLLRTTFDDGKIVDEPIVVSLSVRHPVSSEFTSEIIGTMVNRLLGACITNAGAWRFDQLMRGAMVPKED